MKCIKEYTELLRAGEWIDSKLSYYVVSVALLILGSKLSLDNRDILFMSANALFYASYLGCSYMINDIADRTVDLQAGKKKLITKYSSLSLTIIFTATFLSGLFVISFAEYVLGKFSLPSLAVLIIIYYLGFSYSIRPFRFKERGLPGTVFCSFAQRTLPLFLTVMVYNVNFTLAVILLLQSFFIGMRYILIHQLIDRSNDLKTGVKTFSTEHPAFSRNLIYGNILAEIALIILLNRHIFSIGQLFAASCLSVINVLYFALLIIYIRAVRFMLNENVFETFSFVPFEDYYNIIFPLWLCLCFLSFNTWLIVAAAAILLIQRRMLSVRCEFLFLFGKSTLIRKS